MDLQKQLAQLSLAVNTVYEAYNTCPVYLLRPTTSEAAAIISSLQPNTYTNIAPIFVFEVTPNIPGYPRPNAGEGDQSFAIPKGTLDGDQSTYYTAGFQLFGFAATIAKDNFNVLALRGTVTPQEAGALLWYWNSTSTCALPTGSASTKPYGAVKTGFWSYYSDGGILGQAPLATSLKAATRSVDNAVALPWRAAAHSLGGTMLCLGMLDALVDNCFTKPLTLIATFGSVVVGDAAWASAYKALICTTLRVANLCDFVPSLHSLLPGEVGISYTHVGDPALFVWQTDSNWGNHSLVDIYMPMVSRVADFNLIFMGVLKYPASIGGILSDGRGALESR